ncbi:MAG TPA: lytic transglycosylase domain-containing protein [Holophagaceae bacterium]|nr:lytic transglycosylase domain-containing protein [Holophagaceae bacterium]
MSILNFASLVKAVADRYGYDPGLLAAQAQAESRGNPAAISPVGAIGLMQFMPGTWGDYGRGRDPKDPEASLDAGVRYMKDLLAHYTAMGAASPVELALAAYNWGQGNVDKKVHELGRTDWAGLVAALPAETQAYVPEILGLVATYRAALGAAKVALPGLALAIGGLLGFLVLRRLFL